MKLIERLLLALPFIVVTFLYLRLNLSDEGCWGLVEVMYTILLFILFAVTVPLAFLASLRKRQLQNKKPEPITLTIALITLAALLIGRTFGENLKGKKWIYAETNDYKSPIDLTLRENGTFKVEVGHVDFSCFYSGKYIKLGDTILLENEIIKQTDSALTTKYILKDSLLIPQQDERINEKKLDSLLVKR